MTPILKNRTLRFFSMTNAFKKTITPLPGNVSFLDAKYYKKVDLLLYVDTLCHASSGGYADMYIQSTMDISQTTGRMPRVMYE